MSEWADIAPRASGLCTRCRRREVETTLRMFVQERAKGKHAGKTLAGRALRLCEPCAKEVFAWTSARLEEVAASVRLPDDNARDALAYAVTYLEADLDGRELNDGIDLDYLRRALGPRNVPGEAGR